MKKYWLILIISLMATGCRPSGVISPSDMQFIYYDIFLADQVVTYNANIRSQLDTLSLYGGILEHYGYTPEEFFNSIDYYLVKPAKYRKILTNVRNRFATERGVLLEKERIEDFERQVQDSIKNDENLGKTPAYQSRKSDKKRVLRN